MQPGRWSRRCFLQSAIAGASAVTLADGIAAQTSSASATGLPTRVLGKTGVRVSILGRGGAHIRQIKEDSE